MSKIKVALRTRPLSTREVAEGYPIVVEVAQNSAFITDIRVPEKPAADSRHRLRKFDFDHTFWVNHSGEYGASQDEVYNEMGPCLEKSVLEGYNACLLAYGQSGTGKTHTMLGTKADPGLIPRFCQNIWTRLKESREISTFRMEVSFMEIYREKVRDLFESTPDKRLKLREHPLNGPHVQDLTKVRVTEEIGIADLLWEGEKRRAMGQTGSNRRSSRSHAVWTLYLSYQKQGENISFSSTTEGRGMREEEQLLFTNQVHLVDLAGSEKAELTTSKNLLAEGADINRSLVSLGNVISSLAEKAQYIPYRDSALTWLLKDSLGGNATTSIIITASPASVCHAQTLNSLRFAQRARLVENLPTVNLTSASPRIDSIASLFDIRKDIARLSNILKVAQSNGGLLRGLTPRNGWNRLIEAIESWNHVEKRSHRPTSTENSTSTPPPASTKSSSTMTNSATKSLNDVMIQADIQCYEDARACKSSTSVPNSPCRQSSSSSPSHHNNNFSSSDEVFIPKSSSIKCLTWSQSEIESIPETIPIDSDDEYISPPSTPHVLHLKNIFPVHFPTTHNLDLESRMREMNSCFSCDYPSAQYTFPREVKSDCENSNVVIRHRLPTLVNPQPMNIFECSESSTSNCSNSGGGGGGVDTDPDFEFQDFEFAPKPRLVLAKGSGKKRIHRSSSKIKEFVTPKPPTLQLLESTDEYEFSDCLEVELNQSANKNMRTVDFHRQVKLEDVKSPFLNDPISGESPVGFYYSESESDSGTKKSYKSSKSSSYASLIVHKPVGRVKIVEESKCTFPDDHVTELSTKDFKGLEKRVATVTVQFGKEVQDECPCEKVDDYSEGKYGGESNVNSMENKKIKKPFDGSSSTKFRNFYIRELQKLEMIGKQIKSLQLLAQRYDVLKPFLKKLENLQNEDFTVPDPELDSHIDHCSGCNVDIEFNKVQSEVLAISKILKNNASNGLVGKLPRRDSSSASNHSNLSFPSSTSTNSGSYSPPMMEPSRRGSGASSNVFEPNPKISSRGSRNLPGHHIPPDRTPPTRTSDKNHSSNNKSRNGSSSSSSLFNYNLNQFDHPKQREKSNKKSGARNSTHVIPDSRKNSNASSSNSDFPRHRPPLGSKSHSDREETKKMDYYYQNINSRVHPHQKSNNNEPFTQTLDSSSSNDFLNDPAIQQSNPSSFTSSISNATLPPPHPPPMSHYLDNYSSSLQHQFPHHNQQSTTPGHFPGSSSAGPPYAYSCPTFKNDYHSNNNNIPSQRYPTTIGQSNTNTPGFFVPPYAQFNHNIYRGGGYSSSVPFSPDKTNHHSIKSQSQHQFNFSTSTPSTSTFPFSLRPPPASAPAKNPSDYLRQDFLTQDYGFSKAGVGEGQSHEEDEEEEDQIADSSDFSNSGLSSSPPSSGQRQNDNKHFNHLSLTSGDLGSLKFQSSNYNPYRSLSFEPNNYCSNCASEFCSCAGSLSSERMMMNGGDHNTRTLGLGEFVQNKIKTKTTSRPFQFQYGPIAHSLTTRPKNLYSSTTVSYN